MPSLKLFEFTKN